MKSLMALLVCSAPTCLFGQAFVNLDFESATVVPVTTPFARTIDAALAFPGWSIVTGGTTNGFVFNNDVTLTPYASAALFSRTNSTFGTAVIDGNYSFWMNSGLLYPTPTPAVASDTILAQSGLVPTGSRSLLMKVSNESPFSVGLGGTSLSLIPLSTTARYTLYGADVSAFEGMSEELRITVPYSGNWPFGVYNSLIIDSISFSPNPIPEPGTWALLGLGAAAWLLTKGRRR
jgi:hypothetical protein